jgi:HD-GYP domain-containing protein (c-di-GMP phosphodiesterase class II)
VRHHHERIDGTGYPDGLLGADIPLESRIIHVADAFEAMTSDRPYRKAPGQAYAIDELRRNSGTQFDADVVEALIRRLDPTGGVRQAQLEAVLSA